MSRATRTELGAVVVTGGDGRPRPPTSYPKNKIPGSGVGRNWFLILLRELLMSSPEISKRLCPNFLPVGQNGSSKTLICLSDPREDGEGSQWASLLTNALSEGKNSLMSQGSKALKENVITFKT